MGLRIGDVSNARSHRTGNGRVYELGLLQHGNTVTSGDHFVSTRQKISSERLNPNHLTEQFSNWRISTENCNPEVVTAANEQVRGLYKQFCRQNHSLGKRLLNFFLNFLLRR